MSFRYCNRNRRIRGRDYICRGKDSSGINGRGRRWGSNSRGCLSCFCYRCMNEALNHPITRYRGWPRRRSFQINRRD